MTDYNHDNNWDIDFDKDLDIDIDFNQSFDTDINFDKDVYIDVEICVDAHVEGNTAQLTFDVQAVGYDTFAELDFVVMTIEDQLSSVSGAATSAVG